MKKNLFKKSPRARTFFVLLIFLFAGFQYAGAQIKVTGLVTDNNKVPLPGVNIQVQGTSVGGITDIEGKYSIEVADANATFIFSSLGYATQTLALEGRTTLDISMEEETKIEEVVITGYGTSKKVTTTGSIVSAKGSDIERAPTTNLSNSLVGQLPGLVAVSRSGEPGYDGSTLRIRGSNTLGDNSPLIVVDGIPNRSLERLNATDIESVTILKDASAAIYGSQAANGVILVITKRGKSGSKPIINFNGNMGWSQPTRIPEMADAPTYATMLNEISYYKTPANGRYQNYSEDDITKYGNGSDPWGHPNTDWFDEVFKKWSAQNNANVSISGGTENIKYFLSLGSKFQDAVYKNSATNYKQYDFRSNIDAKINKYIGVSLDVAGRQENRNFPTRSAGSSFRMLMRGKPTMQAYWPNGDPGPDIEYGDNPVVTTTAATGYDDDKRYVLQSNLRTNIEIPWIKGLSLVANASIDKNFLFRKRFETPWYLYTWDGNANHITTKGKRGLESPQLTQYSADKQDINLNGYLTYETSLASIHNIKIMAGTERRHGIDNKFEAFRKNYLSSTIDQLFAGATDQYMTNTGSASQYALMSYFGRVNYDYDQKYLVEFVWRYDGSNKFAKGNQFGFFPAVSAGWRMSEENFWKNNISFITNFKLRGSWGQTGNDRIKNYAYLSTYEFTQGKSYVFGVSNDNKLLNEARIPNPAVTWEVSNQMNIGFDASLLQGKMIFSFEYFKYKRSQILIKRNASVPVSAGLSLPPENIGIVSNRGVEGTIGYNGKVSDLSYNVSFNGSYSINNVEFWDETPGIPEYQRNEDKPIPTYNSDNETFGEDRYYQSLGIFVDQAAVDAYPHWAGARPGDVIFEDVNGDGAIDGLDRVRSEKNDLPRFIGGLNIGIQYKQFDLAMLVQGATGAQQYIGRESGEIGNYYQEDADGRWTPENPSSTKARAWNRDEEYWRSQPNTYWIRKTDYVRLKTIEIGYNLPDRLNTKIGLQNLRVYFSGQNLFTLDKCKLIDPELTAGTSYPLQRVINGGISITF